MKRALSLFALLFLPLVALGQFTWPTYPVHAKTQIYKVMKDNGSGVAILATNDGTMFLGINQNAVVTSSGTVQIVPSGPSQVQVGATPVTMGTLVTSDANGNVVPFSPAIDNAQHCYLGYVAGLNGGTGAANSFVYVAIAPVCARYSVAGGAGGVTSFNARTGAVLPASGDYTVGQVTGAAPLASPTFTGTVTMPTNVDYPPTVTLAPTSGGTITNATTGAVTDLIYTNSLGGSQIDLNSAGTVALTGVSVTAPTPAATDSSTKVATTAFVPVHFARITVSSAAILAHTVTPIIAAPGAGKYIVPLMVVFNYKFITAAYAVTAANMSVFGGTGSGPWVNSDLAGFIDQTSDQVTTAFSAAQSVNAPPVASSMQNGASANNFPIIESTIDNGALNFQATGTISAGSGTIDVLVWYQIVPKA